MTHSRLTCASLALVPFGSSIDPQYWTLGSEICFYSLVLLLLLLRKFHQLERLAILLGVVGTVFVGWLLLARWQDWTLAHHLAKLTRGSARVAPIYYGQFFALGMLTFIWAREKISSAGKLVLGISLFGCCLQVVDVHNRYSKEVLASVDLYALWYVPVLAFLVSYAVVAASASGAIRMAPNGWLRRLGLATYPLYLIHVTIGATIVRVLWSYGVPPVLGLGISVSFLVIISIFVIPLFESHIRVYLRRLFARFEVSRSKPVFLYSSGGHL